MLHSPVPTRRYAAPRISPTSALFFFSDMIAHLTEIRTELKERTDSGSFAKHEDVSKSTLPAALGFPAPTGKVDRVD